MNSKYFIQDLENLYKSHSIYRAIVVTMIGNETMYKNLLEKYNHTIMIVDTITNIDYEDISGRVLIMNTYIFDKFIDHMCNKKYTSYNLISFTYDLDEEIKKYLKEKYYKVMNNIDNTIIM